MKVFMVQISVTVPVLAEDEDAAALYAERNIRDMLHEPCWGAEALASDPRHWGNCFPYGGDGVRRVRDYLAARPREEESDHG